MRYLRLLAEDHLRDVLRSSSLAVLAAEGWVEFAVATHDVPDHGGRGVRLDGCRLVMEIAVSVPTIDRLELGFTTTIYELAGLR